MGKFVLSDGFKPQNKEFDPGNDLQDHNIDDSDASLDDADELAVRSHYVDMEPSRMRGDIEMEELLKSDKYKGITAASRQDLYSDVSKSDFEHDGVSSGLENLVYSDDAASQSDEDGAIDFNEQTHIQSEIEKLAQQQAQYLSNLKQGLLSDAQKGKHVRNQLAVGDALLDLRIRSQKLFQLANMLPIAEVSKLWYQEQSSAQVLLRQKCKQNLISFISTLLDVSERQIHHCPDIFTEQKEEFNFQCQEPAYKRLKLQEKQFGSAAIKQTVDKWQSKLNVQSRKGLKVLDQPVSVQVANILKNDNLRVLKRTRQNRIVAEPIGTSLISAEKSSLIFDDYDFYQLQLKELISQRSTTIGDNEEHQVKLKQLSRQKRQDMHRRLNKDRTVKHVVIDKLVNFMTSRIDPNQLRDPWHEEMIHELSHQLQSTKQ